MPSKSEILDGMEYAWFTTYDPINTTDAAAYTISYQFESSRPADLPSPEAYTDWTAFTAAEKAKVRDMLDHVETLINVRYVEVTGSADPDMNFGKVRFSDPVTGRGGPAISVMGNSIVDYDGFALYRNIVDVADRPDLILHEIGHALGLKHPFESPALPADYDNNKFTVMSYDFNPDTGADTEAMMVYDILALQDIWGAADNNDGNTTYTGSRTATVDAVWDSGGTDRFSADGRKTAVKLDLREASFSSFDDKDDVVIAYGTRIENATGGTGADTIIGNGSKNLLLGGGGNDSIKGGGNADKLKGGIGKDVLEGQAGNDKLFGNNGNDTMLGGNGNDTLYGGGGRDSVKGGNGKDTLNGQAGDDTLRGNGGADRFIFAKGGDKDRIVDFQDDVDTIKFTGHGSKAAVMAAASEIGGDVVFDFGRGDVLTVLNITIDALSDDILV